MKLLCSVLILASVAVTIQAKPSSVQLQLQGALDKYLVNANNLDVLSADVTTQCFSLYMPMLNEVAATFSSSYQDCITAYNTKLANITAQATQDQTMYKQEVTEMCSAFTTCDNGTDSDTTGFFTCYANAAQGDVSVIYDIATNAASTANTLAEAIKVNQDLEYQCTNTTESNYVRDTAATYELLDNCLRNGLPTTAAAPLSTTAAPLSTTQSVSASTASVVVASSAVPAASSAGPVVIATTAASIV
ncbi:uncharacterized protein LOC6560329 [Drosophila grimshawi]|uniref:GH20454 n=1 Tax=Drosophila grimshawi TaxID=7222 RepID=B4J9F9_DROGR|nr:uncharacterized protein LOC6560329 [Drosophila grimshawi]EDW01440.1 GH20454 [Drosophila grimshawi]